MKKLENKVAVITGGTSGMALATAKLFVEEGAYAFITGRDEARLDKAVKEIGRNVTGVLGDAANLEDLDRIYETVRKEKGKIDNRPFVFFRTTFRLARSCYWPIRSAVLPLAKVAFKAHTLRDPEGCDDAPLDLLPGFAPKLPPKLIKVGNKLFIASLPDA
jgi:hypothetical protein